MKFTRDKYAAHEYGLHTWALSFWKFRMVVCWRFNADKFK